MIITGANSGIGKAAALKFAKEGYTVIMACRNIQLSEKTRDDIITESKNINVDLMKLDISSFKSINKFCSEYKSKYGRLDILIHNAGYFNHGEKECKISEDGIELTFATNVFGPYLMTNLLLDVLLNSENPRILNACSTNIKHFFDEKRKLDLDNLQGELKGKKKNDVYKMYGDSKMALLILTFKMAEEFKNHNININALMIPSTKMSPETLKKFKSFWRILGRIQNLFNHNTEEIGNKYFHICTSNEFKNISGELLNSEGKVMRKEESSDHAIDLFKKLIGSDVYPKYARDNNMIENIWDLCNKLTSNYLSSVN